ncbi:LOW QUALITY PROTEIN: hypothetical protein Cgig2_014990 [Carnegiea gigantea]|uniref:Uncharacterized protein n=1 Tax=Carnegiea gigantea TaxID=171969 RepID=A0A9Q1KL65_9CARY|nr:LOW QUALITY PROTEIN: hypothetical protein Cgig2_014990 [Carnegiea gigantea]
MAFPCSLSTSEMAQYVAYHFEWDRRGVTFPLLPLPNDFQALCQSYELAVAEEFAQRFELPELPQVIFYAMLLKEAERSGVLHGRTLRIMESALIELHWSTFEEWGRTEIRFCRLGSGKRSSKRKRARTPRGLPPLQMMRSRKRKEKRGSFACPLYYGVSSSSRYQEDGRLHEGALRWHWRSATCPPRLLPDDYQDLCPRFTLPDVEKAAVDFEVPEMVQATFYAILLNDVVGLGIVSGFMAVDLKLTVEGLRRTSFEAWLSHTSRELLEV